jgi:mRNA interferase RelE/StbE
MDEKRYKIRFAELALENLGALPKPQSAQILKKIVRLENGLCGNIKRLQNADCAYRLRMGDYRALFDVDGNEIVIQKIGHRKDVYE